MGGEKSELEYRVWIKSVQEICRKEAHINEGLITERNLDDFKIKRAMRKLFDALVIVCKRLQKT